ncbi:D-Ala-D-Ala carboxypeptidase family metallohydrolase [Xylanibacter ruminicola]|uniref:Peptidase M15 n=1 Tax=Xylanibacter ruminicola TaxID=839 RepID=A0A1M6TKD7_XYLRU|nr:D-Ala-D-Ala carboxypeptidase family metallohydrolase [Xylanibacter ruminicola]SHK57404.1 Peptidase M15 [Xylanibacter ruminicola]
MNEIVQLNSKMKLSEHFTLGEMTKSNSHPEVYNIPSHEAIANLKRVCVWLEELRKRYNQPIIINSGYRSPQLNRAIGGVATSNHLTGCAVDIRVDGLEQLIVYAAILLDISRDWQQEFDELLIERRSASPLGSSKNKHGAIWLHFAVRAKDNRRKVLFINA